MFLSAMACPANRPRDFLCGMIGPYSCLCFTLRNITLLTSRDLQAQKALLHREFDYAGWECAQILSALDRAEELYFDTVSQIRMDCWSRGRVALVGDSAFAPSLLAGQGSALAMTAAYVLAGELAVAEGEYARAFERYECVLRAFIDGKQKAAEQFARSFVPRTRLGLLVHNQLSKTLQFPFVVNLLIGRGLLDRLTLPAYPLPSAPIDADKRQEAKLVG